MPQDAVQALAIRCIALALIAGGSVLFFGLWRAAAAMVVNAVLALLFLAVAAPRLLVYVWDPQAFIQRYGRAAVSGSNEVTVRRSASAPP